MGSFLVEAMSDPTAVMQRAAHYLAADPVQLNLVWSILRQRAESGVPGSYWLLEADGVATGIVLESPPAHGAAISPVQPEEAVCLAEAISGEGHRLTGISGVASTSAAFAGRWTEKTATSAVVEEAQRLYVLDCLCPAEAVPGNLRRAEFFERGLLTEWWSAFQVETGSARLDVSAAVDLALGSWAPFRLGPRWSTLRGARHRAPGRRLADRRCLHPAPLAPPRLRLGMRRGLVRVGAGVSKAPTPCSTPSFATQVRTRFTAVSASRPSRRYSPTDSVRWLNTDDTRPGRRAFERAAPQAPRCRARPSSASGPRRSTLS